MGHIQLVVPVAHIWYFRSLPNKIGYLLGLPTKKLDAIIYYERYVVIQPGVLSDEVAQYDLLEEGEYLDLLEKLPKDNQFLEDSDPNKFIAKMGAEAIMICCHASTLTLCLTNCVTVPEAMLHSNARLKP